MVFLTDWFICGATDSSLHTNFLARLSLLAEHDAAWWTGPWNGVIECKAGTCSRRHKNSWTQKDWLYSGAVKACFEGCYFQWSPSYVLRFSVVLYGLSSVSYPQQPNRMSPWCHCSLSSCWRWTDASSFRPNWNWLKTVVVEFLWNYFTTDNR